MKSALFIPCEERKLSKLSELDADIIIFDLEDSIKDEDKENALNRLLELLQKQNDKGKFAVRVNCRNDFFELDKLYEAGIRSFMLPKSENVEYINKIGLRFKDIKLILLIETAKGIVNLKDMCQIGSVSSVAFGAEDFCLQTTMLNRDDILVPIKEQILIIAKAYEKEVFDTITLEIYDEEIIKQKIISSKELGFDGKLYIHPKQIEVYKAVRLDDNKEELKKIIDMFENNSEGVLVYKGKVYEKPHIEAMRRMLNETEK